MNLGSTVRLWLLNSSFLRLEDNIAISKAMAVNYIYSTELRALPENDAISSNLFSSGARKQPPEDEMRSAEIPIRGIGYLQCLSDKGRPALPSVLSACWALLLNRYSGVDSTFNYIDCSQSRLMECGTDSLLRYRCHIEIEESETLLSLLERTRGLFERAVEGEVGKTKDDNVVTDSSVLYRNGKTSTSVREILSVLQLNRQSFLLDAWSRHEQTEMRIYYRSSKMPYSMAQNIAFTLGKLLSDINVNSGNAIGTIDFLSQHDLDQVWGWNSRLPEPYIGSVHGLIAAHAHSVPDFPALCSWESTLSYRELDELSMRLASQLSYAGAHRGMIVPLLFEKSIWAVVTAVAVMKTGAAFVLLDINQPDGRLKDIVAQAKSKLLVTSAAQEARGKHVAVFEYHTVVTRNSIDNLPTQTAFSSLPHTADELL